MPRGRKALGLDKSTLTFLAGQEPNDFDHAIDLAAIADVEGKFWEAIHGPFTIAVITCMFFEKKAR